VALSDHVTSSEARRESGHIAPSCVSVCRHCGRAASSSRYATITSAGATVSALAMTSRAVSDPGQRHAATVDTATMTAISVPTRRGAT